MKEGIPLLVRFPVVDLRREPVAAKKKEGKDILQESQLLYNEPLYGYERHLGWMRVGVPMQSRHMPDGAWQDYSGWIQIHQAAVVEEFIPNNIVVNVLWAAIYRYPDGASQIVDVCLGTRLTGVGEPEEGWRTIILPDGSKGYILDSDVVPLPLTSTPLPRLELLKRGKEFIGSPYLWGGKSAHHPFWHDTQTGVDCSGLVHLLYSLYGITLPRDAHDQYLKSQRCEPRDLQPADLIFLASAEKPNRINHVMLYAGGDLLLEATAQSWTVREISCEEKCGKPLAACHHGERLGDIILFTGRIEPGRGCA